MILFLISGLALLFGQQGAGSLDAVCQVDVLTANSPAQLDRFGEAIAVSPDRTRLFVGCPRRLPTDLHGQGAVDVFRIGRSGHQLTYEATINMPLMEDGPQFGVALAAIGDELIIGAPGADPSESQNAGRLYVAKPNEAGEWGLAELPTTRLCPNRRFASSVVATTSGRFAVCHNGCGGLREIVVYERGRGEQWEIFAVISAPSSESLGCPEFCLHQFGTGYGLSSDTIAIGVSNSDTDGGLGSGRVLIYEQDESGQWVIVQQIMQPDPEDYSGFGENMVFDGDDTLYVISGYRLSPDPGRVTRFRRDGDGVWQPDSQYQIGVYSSNGDSAFGASIALSPDRSNLAVAAPGDDTPGELRNGMLYDFDLDKGVVEEFRYIDEQTRFGAVSVEWFAEDILLTGEPEFDFGDQLRAGRVVLYDMARFTHCWHDLDRDGVVGGMDILQLFRQWNTAVPEADLDCSGSVGFSDLLSMLSNWGECLFVPPGAP